MVDISIVIPTLNEEKNIKICIDSLLNQTYKASEIIIVDSGNDATYNFCKELGLNVIKTEKGNIAKARHEGFMAAKSQVIVSTDADTVFDKNWLYTIAKEFELNNIDCIYGPVTFKDGNVILRKLSGPLFKAFVYFSKIFFRKNYITGMNFAIKKDFYTKIGGFDSSRITAEDVDLGFRMSGKGKIVYKHSLKVYTSSRRYMHYGIVKVQIHHFKNYLNLFFKNKTSTNFDPVR